MKRRHILMGIGLLLILALCTLGGRLALQFVGQTNFAGMAGDGGVANLDLPEGFEAQVFASDLQSPRFIHFGPDGHLYVAERGADRVLILKDMDGDGQSDAQQVFAEALGSPHSLVFHEGSWYVGIPTGVLKLTDENQDGESDRGEVIIGDYPTSGHGTRTVDFLPDGRMVVSVGSSCNVCEEDDPRRASVMVYDGPAGGGEALFASGLRNAVGLAVHPLSGDLWASNNGRDLMGDDLPPETIFRLQEGGHYGWPWCHNGHLEDPDMGFSGSCDGVLAPVVEMQAHSAPLGIAFYTGDSFPTEMHGDLFIAFHGSWNRSVPTGYKIVRLPLDGSQVVGELQDFVVGWLNQATQEVTGRPVGLAIGPDGALYISDDKGGIIYRVQYVGP
jgi:glucose/arabinose dehydrogenase